MKASKNTPRRLFLLCLFGFSIQMTVCGAGYRVQENVSGTVYDEDGERIIGATVQVEKTKKGTITNASGRFSIEAPPDEVLTVSYLGYVTQKIAIGKRTEIRINLEPDTKILDEVVVIGYGTVLKSDLTGSVSKLRDEKADEKPYTSMEQMLQGRSAGVQITQNSGALGGGITFLVRGANSVSGNNQPLVVIDGYPVESGNLTISAGIDGTYGGDMEGMNVLSTLDPNDIESIEILKDASSTAIYGSRGANGVVMVTTKRGKAGRERINYTFRNDWKLAPEPIEVLSTPEFMAYANEAQMDLYTGALRYNQTSIERYRAINTNWQDLVYQTGYSQSHQLKVSGGDKKMKYSVSLGYTGQTGIIKNSRYDRGTFGLNLDREINAKLSLTFNLNGSRIINKAVAQSSSTGSNPSSSVITGALRIPPVHTAYEANDIAEISGTTNPLTMVTKASDVFTYSLVRASGTARYKLTKAFSLKYNAGTNISYGERKYYMPRDTFLGDQRGGYAYTGDVKSFDWLSEFTVNYNTVFRKKHHVDAVAGYTWQTWEYLSEGQAVAGFPSDKQTYYNLNAGAMLNKPRNSLTKWSLASLIGRINYTFDKKYLLTVTMRYDGSSRLAEENRWDLFPSVALGWNMHNEPFMKKTRKTVSEWKWRASYGTSGNQAVRVGAVVPQYGNSTGVVNGEVVTVYLPGSLSNPELGWERTGQTDLGMDLGFFKNRITLSIDAYRKLSTGLLMNLSVPGSIGYSAYTDNVGEVENKGMEFDLSAHVLTGRFKWKTSGNISFNRNKILKLDGTQTASVGPSFNSVGYQSMHIAMVGHPIGSFYGYRIIGIYQTQDEILNSPVDPAGVKPGYFKFADLNGDNEITDADREIIGDPYPDYTFGLNNDLSWKNFSLNVFIQGSVGQDVINANRYYLDALTGVSYNVSREAYQNRWTGPGTSNTWPVIVSSSSAAPFLGRFSDFIIEDASYVRLKSVTLSYSVPAAKVKWLQNMKVFVTGTNLFTVTRYTGYDPEINSRGQNAMTPGVDYGSIPQFRSFSAGFNIGF